MKILIVEDEIRIAKLLEKQIRVVWAGHLTQIHHCRHLGEARNFLSKYPIDLLFLDLNLKGESGFQLLKEFLHSKSGWRGFGEGFKVQQTGTFFPEFCDFCAFGKRQF